MAVTGLRGIRDKLISERTLYNENLAKMTQIGSKVQQLVSGIDEDTLKYLMELGHDPHDIINVDTERLKSDTEYLQEYKRKVSLFITEVRDHLERMI